MANEYANTVTGLDSPAKSFFAITPHDSSNFTNDARGIYVGTGGNISILPVDGGSAVTFSNVPGGTVLPVMARRINATGTSASNLIGLF